MVEGKEGEFIYKRSSFIEMSDYEREVGVTINNLLIERLRLLGINSQDLKDIVFITKYNVGRDTSLMEEDFTRKLHTYRAYGIKVLLVEYTRTYTKIVIPNAYPGYEISIGSPGDVNFIPSTIAFIKEYKPESGYQRDEPVK